MFLECRLACSLLNDRGDLVKISSISETSLLRACNLPGRVLHKSRSSLKARHVEAAAIPMPTILALVDSESMVAPMSRLAL